MPKGREKGFARRRRLEALPKKHQRQTQIPKTDRKQTFRQSGRRRGGH